MIFQELIDSRQNIGFKYTEASFRWLSVSNQKDDLEAVLTKMEGQDQEIETSEYLGSFHFETTAKLAESLEVIDKFKAFLIDSEQACQFADANITDLDLHYLTKMKLPFDMMFIDFNGTIKVPCGDDKVLKNWVSSEEIDRDFYYWKGMFIWRLPNAHPELKAGETLFLPLDKRLLDLLLMDTRDTIIKYRETDDLKEFLASLFPFFSGVGIVGDEKTSIAMPTHMGENARKLLINLAVGICLFINSINVNIVEVLGSTSMSKKRRKQGKPIPADYYICKLEQKEIHTLGHSLEGGHHGFRYDVRGHFKHYTKGVRAGRTSWIPPHQRGLANSIYKPKVYSLK